jgi:signal transduction histidine kinase
METVAAFVLGAVAVVAVAVALRARSTAREATAASEGAERSTRDLKGRLRATDEERRSMALALSSMREGVVLLSGTGAVTYANPALETLQLARPSSLDALLPLGLRDAVRRTMDGQVPSVAEVETGAPSRWLRGEAFPVGDDGSVLLVVRDVTEARRVDSIRREFVANASHELKTPAASIQAAAETLRTAALEDPAVVPRFAAQLEQEASRLSRIVSDLLDLSRLETGSDLDEEVALDTILRDEGERFETPAREAGVELAVDAMPVPRIQGSARDLALMVRNLVDNAIRYTRPGGCVKVSLGAVGGHVTLTVADTGLGIPSRDLPRVFERFYRVDRARSRETGGTGLGLSIVKHVAENHGGSVRVESELGAGSTFEVRLPASP